MANVELLSENLIKLSKARKRFPGRGVSPSCFERWVQKGINGARLEVCKIGDIRYTSEEAIQRFLLAMNRNDEPEVLGKPVIRRMSEKEIEQKKREYGFDSIVAII